MRIFVVLDMAIVTIVAVDIADLCLVVVALFIPPYNVAQ